VFFQVYAAILLPAHALLRAASGGRLDAMFFTGVALHGTVLLAYFVLTRLGDDSGEFFTYV
jgi:hypothetical protein